VRPPKDGRFSLKYSRKSLIDFESSKRRLFAELLFVLVPAGRYRFDDEPFSDPSTHSAWPCFGLFCPRPTPRPQTPHRHPLPSHNDVLRHQLSDAGDRRRRPHVLRHKPASGTTCRPAEVLHPNGKWSGDRQPPAGTKTGFRATQQHQLLPTSPARSRTASRNRAPSRIFGSVSGGGTTRIDPATNLALVSSAIRASAALIGESAIPRV